MSTAILAGCHARDGEVSTLLSLPQPLSSTNDLEFIFLFWQTSLAFSLLLLPQTQFWLPTTITSSSFTIAASITTVPSYTTAASSHTAVPSDRILSSCYHYCQSVDTTTVSPHVPCNSVYLSATFSSPFARSLGILFPNTPASFMTFPATSGCLVNTGMNQVLWL